MRRQPGFEDFPNYPHFVLYIQNSRFEKPQKENPAECVNILTNFEPISWIFPAFLSPLYPLYPLRLSAGYPQVSPFLKAFHTMKNRKQPKRAETTKFSSLVDLFTNLCYYTEYEHSLLRIRGLAENQWF